MSEPGGLHDWHLPAFFDRLPFALFITDTQGRFIFANRAALEFFGRRSIAELRGKGLDVELSLDARVGGSTARPTLSGTARVVRGEYDFAGKRFEFDDRGVVYLATSPQAISPWPPKTPAIKPDLTDA